MIETPPDGSVSIMRLRIDQADGLAAGLTSGLSSGLVPGLVTVDGTGFSVGTALPAGLLHAPTNRAAARMSKASNGFMERPPGGSPDTLARSHRREDPLAYLVWAVPGSPRPTEAGARGTARPTLMRALAEWSSNPNLPQLPTPAMSEFTYAPEFTRSTIGATQTRSPW